MDQQALSYNFYNMNLNSKLDLNQLSQNSNIKSKYRIKRPFSALSNTTSEPPHPNKKFKYQSTTPIENCGEFHINNFNLPQVQNLSESSNKISPVFSMDGVRSQQSDIEMSYCQTPEKDSKKTYLERMKKEMSNYQSQMKRSDNKYIYDYRCCEEKDY